VFWQSKTLKCFIFNYQNRESWYNFTILKFKQVLTKKYNAIGSRAISSLKVNIFKTFLNYVSNAVINDFSVEYLNKQPLLMYLYLFYYNHRYLYI